MYALKKTLEKRIDRLGTTVDVEDTIREIKRSEDDDDEEASERNEEKLIGLTLHKGSSRLSKEKTEISNILMDLENLGQIDSKLGLLVDSIETIKKTDPHAKMVIFTEYRDTMNYLMKNLKYKVEHIWGFEFSSYDKGKFYSDNGVDAVILKNKEIVDVYADKIANDLLTQTSLRLAEIELKVEESVLEHYRALASEIDTKIHQYEEKVAESPSYSRFVQRETMKKEKLLKELDEKIDETKRDFDTS